MIVLLLSLRHCVTMLFPKSSKRFRAGHCDWPVPHGAAESLMPPLSLCSTNGALLSFSVFWTLLPRVQKLRTVPALYSKGCWILQAANQTNEKLGSPIGWRQKL